MDLDVHVLKLCLVQWCNCYTCW